ncbi:MAG: flippase-like domain-containing protein [Muribaculaceae bacterium]
MDSISTHNNPPAQAAESFRQPILYDNISGAGNPGKRNAEKPLIKKIIGDIIRYLVPLAISIGLIVWMFHKVDFQKVMKIIHDGCDFFWIGAMMLITTVSHMIRGTRWGLQLRAAGVARMTLLCEWVTIWGAYALNLVFPQLGEGWRCVFVSKRQKAPLSTVIGTDVGDRGSDLIVVLLLLLISLIVAHPFIMDFLTKYAIGKDVERITDDPLLWIGIGGLVAVAWAILHYCRTYKWVKTLDTNITRIWNGFKVIFTMTKWWLYVIYTIGIWTCYFFETYVCFFAFDFTRGLVHNPHMAAGFIPGLVVFVFGSMSMAIPSNGGLGPWNLAVMFALTLFGLSSEEGTAFSIVMWSCQAVMLIALGLFSAVYVAVTGRKKQNLST